MASRPPRSSRTFSHRSQQSFRDRWRSAPFSTTWAALLSIPRNVEESKTYHEKHIQLKPARSRALLLDRRHRLVAGLSRQSAICARITTRPPRKPFKDADPMPPALATQFKDKYGPIVDEGIDRLCKKAIELTSRLRRRHGLPEPPLSPEGRYGNRSPALAMPTLKQADDLVEKVKAIKQQKAAKTRNRRRSGASPNASESNRNDEVFVGAGLRPALFCVPDGVAKPSSRLAKRNPVRAQKNHPRRTLI